MTVAYKTNDITIVIKSWPWSFNNFEPLMERDCQTAS